MARLMALTRLACAAAVLLAALTVAHAAEEDALRRAEEQTHAHAHAHAHAGATVEDTSKFHVSFTVPLFRSVNHDKRAAALSSLKLRQMRMMERKQGGGSSEGAAVALLETRSRDIPLEEEILSEKHLATYFGHIGISGHDFKVLFDTGSCEFWVPSSLCTTSRCMRHNRFPQNIGTQRIASSSGMNIQYLSGKVAGDMVYETVKLGDVEVRNQVVGLAKQVDIELLDDVQWDGIMGLAYPNPVLTQQGITPLFDTIVQSKVLSGAPRHLANQFAYYIDDTKGSVTFGGANCDFLGPDKSGCVDKFKFVPVTEKTYWTVTLKDVRVKYPNRPEISGNCPAQGCKAIVDTGTYLVYGPENQVSNMLTKQLQSCAHHGDMPSFTFDFLVNKGDAPVSLTINPIDYILKFNVRSRDECVVGISPDKDVIWTLGQVFLRTFYTVFDRDEDRIGFAHLKRTRFNAINHRLPTSLVEEQAQRMGDKTERHKSRKHHQAFLELKDMLDDQLNATQDQHDPADDIDDF